MKKAMFSMTRQMQLERQGTGAGTGMGRCHMPVAMSWSWQRCTNAPKARCSGTWWAQPVSSGPVAACHLLCFQEWDAWMQHGSMSFLESSQALGPGPTRSGEAAANPWHPRSAARPCPAGLPLLIISFKQEHDIARCPSSISQG